MKKILESLKFIRDGALYPDIKTIEGCPTNPEVIINGKKCLLFCSNNYLGLANSELLKSKAIETIKKYGVGSGGSRLVSGNTDIQLELERKIAKFKNTESAITFSTGFMANSGTIPAIMEPLFLSITENVKNKLFSRPGVILSDELNHASIIEGVRLSQAKKIIYKHKDLNDLESKLKKYRKNRKLIVTDGVFSMDGDIAPVNKIAELSDKYDTILMVDDAHATGVIGEHGGGTTDYFKMDPSGVDVMMGTFTKALGAIGGFIAGTQELIDYLKIGARTYMFSAPITPGNVGAIIAALDEIQNNKSLKERLWENANYFRNGLKTLGFDTLQSETPIIPVLIGEERKAIETYKKLFENNILAPAVRWPAVPKNQNRIRFTVMATHTKDQINYLLNTLVKINQELKIIK